MTFSNVKSQLLWYDQRQRPPLGLIITILLEKNYWVVMFISYAKRPSPYRSSPYSCDLFHLNSSTMDSDKSLESDSFRHGKPIPIFI